MTEPLTPEKLRKWKRYINSLDGNTRLAAEACQRLLATIDARDLRIAELEDRLKGYRLSVESNDREITAMQAVVEAGVAVLADRDAHAPDGVERFMNPIDPDMIPYWSPHSSMIRSDKIAALRSALSALTPTESGRAGDLSALLAAIEKVEQMRPSRGDLLMDAVSAIAVARARFDGRADTAVDAILAELTADREGTDSGRTLGRFGHHPEPDQDFLIECEVIEGIAFEVNAGARSRLALENRVHRALDFNVVLSDCVKAKARLREIAASLDSGRRIKQDGD